MARTRGCSDAGVPPIQKTHSLRWFVAKCMKILYIASERSDAHLAARSLRGISPDFKLLWASNLERAALCMLEFSDVAALVVEVRSDSAGCLHLKRARELGLKAPVVVVLPDGAGSPAESLEAGVDSYLAKNQSFSRELPVVVTRAIDRAQTSARVARGDQLPSGTVGESAAGVPADRQSEGGVSQGQQPLNSPAVAHRPPQSNVEFVSTAGKKSMFERRISELETMFHQREQSWMTEQAAAAERQETLEKLLHQERSTRTGFEQKLADAKAALEDAEHRHSAAITAASEALAERHTQHEVGMARVTSTWDTVDEQLRQWALEVERARQSLASPGATEVARLTEREAALTAQLAEAATIRRSLEAQLGDARTALTEADERATRDRLAATQHATARDAEFGGLIRQERAARADVEQQLAQVEAARGKAEQEHAAAATRVERLAQREAELTSKLAETAADAENALRTANERASQDRRVGAEQAAERHAELQVQLEREVEKRRSLEDDLARARIACDRAEKQHQSAVAAAAALRTEFDADWARADEARKTLGHEARDLEAALNEARQTLKSNAATLERVTRRESELTAQLSEAATTRRSLEGQLADAATAMKDADDRATRDRLAAARYAAARDAEFGGLIRQERATRADVEQQLAQVEAARREADRQHLSAMTTAATTLAERQAQFEVELSQTAAARDDFKRQVHVAETTLAAARHDHAAAATEVERLSRHEAEADRAARRSYGGPGQPRGSTGPTPRRRSRRPTSAPPSATQSLRG